MFWVDVSPLLDASGSLTEFVIEVHRLVAEPAEHNTLMNHLHNFVMFHVQEDVLV
jgi:hypothetical protein